MTLLLVQSNMQKTTLQKYWKTMQKYWMIPTTYDSRSTIKCMNKTDKIDISARLNM